MYVRMYPSMHYLWMYLCMYICMDACKHPFVHSFINQSSIHSFIIHPFVYPSTNTSLHHMSIHHPSIHHLSINPSIHPSTHTPRPPITYRPATCIGVCCRRLPHLSRLSRLSLIKLHDNVSSHEDAESCGTVPYGRHVNINHNHVISEMRANRKHTIQSVQQHKLYVAKDLSDWRRHR
jgi:hypothetical protein